MEATLNKFEQLLENHEKALNLLLRNQKILSENQQDDGRQLDVEVQHLQQQIDKLFKTKKDKKSKKGKKAGKKEKKEKKRSDSSDDDLKLASWRDQRVC